MKSLRTLSLFVLLCLSLPQQIKASHLLGGEITWRCLNNGKYIFTMSLYRDCGGVDLPYTTQYLENNAGISIPMDTTGHVYILPNCYANTTASCQGANSGEGYMEKVTFQSGEIVLHGAPPPSGWTFSWSSCCRPSTVSNLTNSGSQGYYLRAYMYPYIPTGSVTALSAGDTVSGVGTCYDSSPYFLEGPQARTCANTNNRLINNLGIDKDLDSLSYKFSQPMSDSGITVVWESGYSDQSPLPNALGSIPAMIDSLTGVITFNSNLIGSWASCVEVESWKNKQLIGKVFRDIPIFTQACTPLTGVCATSAVSAPPSISVQSDSFDISAVQSLAGDTLLYKIEASPGEIVKFTVNSLDLSPHSNCQSEQLSFVGFGATLSDSPTYANSSSCLLGGPCATLSSNSTSGLFQANDSLSIDFQWTISKSHLAPKVNGQSVPAIYPFYFKVTDDECPINQTTSIVVVVEVDEAVSAAPDVQTSCIEVDLNGHTTLNWTPDPDTANWGAYVIYSIDTTLNPQPLDTLPNWPSSTYIDSNYNPNNTVGYLIGVTNRNYSRWNYSQPILTFTLTDVINNGTQLFAQAGYSYYQWLTCDSSGYTTLPNQVSHQLTPSISGHYAVLIGNGSCQAISDCVYFYSPFSITEHDILTSIFPNPNSEGVLYFEYDGFEVHITDLLGKTVLNNTKITPLMKQLSINELEAGSYILHFKFDEQVVRKTLIVL